MNVLFQFEANIKKKKKETQKKERNSKKLNCCKKNTVQCIYDFYSNY